jgi:transcriptional regulator with XRE-family HTH domain
MLDTEKMKSLRLKHGMTQSEAATLAKLGSYQRWNDIESGRRSSITLVTLSRIACALQVKAKALLK